MSFVRFEVPRWFCLGIPEVALFLPLDRPKRWPRVQSPGQIGKPVLVGDGTWDDIFLWHIGRYISVVYGTICVYDTRDRDGWYMDTISDEIWNEVDGET